MFGSFPPSPLVVCASKVYSGLGADIVMESFHSSTEQLSGYGLGYAQNPCRAVNEPYGVHFVNRPASSERLDC
jgi:hypothetical protein